MDLPALIPGTFLSLHPDLGLVMRLLVKPSQITDIVLEGIRKSVVISFFFTFLLGKMTPQTSKGYALINL